MTEDRSRTDPEIAKRLAQLDLVVGKFPKPRVENAAQQAVDKLREVKKAYGKKGLKTRPQGDTLTCILENYSFLRDEILPVVSELMERTRNAVAFDQKSILGCIYVTEDEGGKGGVELMIADGSDIESPFIQSPESAQEMWDRSNALGRDALRHFAQMSRGELLFHFREFATEYATQ